MFSLLLTTSTFHNTVQRMVEIIAMMAVSLMSRNNSLIKDSNGRRTKNITVDEIIYEDKFLKIFLWKYFLIGYRYHTYFPLPTRYCIAELRPVDMKSPVSRYLEL